jgi:hypothetical protein
MAASAPLQQGGLLHGGLRGGSGKVARRQDNSNAVNL